MIEKLEKRVKKQDTVKKIIFRNSEKSRKIRRSFSCRKRARGQTWAKRPPVLPTCPAPGTHGSHRAPPSLSPVPLVIFYPETFISNLRDFAGGNRVEHFLLHPRVSTVFVVTSISTQLINVKMYGRDPSKIVNGEIVQTSVTVSSTFVVAS